MVQLSHPYMTTGKTIACTRWTFVGKVISLLFNMLSRLVMTFLPTSKHLLISWLQSPSAVILEPKKIKSVTVSIFFPTICYEVMGPDAMIFVFWMFDFLWDGLVKMEEVGVGEGITGESSVTGISFALPWSLCVAVGSDGCRDACHLGPSHKDCK